MVTESTYPLLLPVLLNVENLPSQKCLRFNFVHLHKENRTWHIPLPLHLFFYST